MSEKIIVGPINKGYRNDRTAFVIDNDSFPTLINAYQWRGKVKRKRGTSLLGRLNRFIGTTDGAGNAVITIAPVPIEIGISSFKIGNDVFVDQGGASPVALLTNSSGTGTLNRTTGVLTITGSQISTSIFYFPTLPVMGIEEFATPSVQFPGTLAFDTHYSYNILTASPYNIYDVSYYKNVASGTYPGYVQKTTWTPTTWNGQDYQQFWTVNYQNALWATNGIEIPFDATNVGMQYKPITGVTIGSAGPPAIANLTILGHGLVVGDFLFINEVGGITGINFQTGYVTVVIDPNTVTVEFPNATLGGAYTSGGIAQYLTNRSDTTKDCLRWYDGDPTDGNVVTPGFSTGKGWVNFAPPLSQSVFSVSDLPAAQYYLVGARMIVPFKDRLLFLGPVVQTSAAGSQEYLQDTVIYSQNGTPYYTASFTGDPNSATTVFNPILLPEDQTSAPNTFWEDTTGFGGFIQAGIAQQIITASSNEDALIIGFDNLQTRFIYTGNDIIPFNFYIINTEYGSSSTFSAVNLDKGVITRGAKGFILTSQTGCSRIDLEIPDQVFQTNLTDNGPERICSQRDFINEWMYFTYPGNQVTCKFPNQTLQYNYRDDSWAIFNESYTTYGSFRRQTGFIWSTVGLTYPTWSSWNDPWNAGTTTLLQPEVLAGNQQGFILVRDEGTNEGNSLYIQNMTGSIVTSPHHCLNTNDYIVITGVLGTLGQEVNGGIFKVGVTTTDTFELVDNVVSGTYLGGGLIKRMYRPFIQTKQFPTAWNMGRKTRIGVQQYLLTTTETGKIQLLIYLSQNSSSPYNTGPIVPSVSPNNSLIYGTTLFTCPESTNLGLTPANVNLQTPTADAQDQLWHRVSTSLIGDTVQLGFTMSDAQMAEFAFGEPFAITGASQANPCVLQCTGQFSEGQSIFITGVVGMTQLNDNIHIVASSTPTTVTLDVNSVGFDAYVSGGEAVIVAPNQFSEIEIHAFNLEVSPSQMLV